jgi:hypothetical protein
MQTHSNEQSSAMTRDQWLALLSAHVDPEMEILHNRKQARYAPDFGTATLTFEDESRPVSITGRLLDISASGFMTKLHRKIDCYTAIWAELIVGEDHASVVGYVVHSTPTVGGFKLGVALQFPA